MAAFKVNISKSGNAIKFVFTNSNHYLYGDGEIEVPVNALTLVVDESNMVTFLRSASNDIFLTFDPANSNLSDKAGVINFYKTNMVGSTGGGGGGGITSGEVQTMIDNSISGLTDEEEVEEIVTSYTYSKDEVDSGFSTVNQALSGKADTTAVTASINSAVSGKADTSAVTAVNNALTAHTSDTIIHVTSQDKQNWGSKANVVSLTQAQYDALVSAGTVDSNTVYNITDATEFDPSTKADASALTQVEQSLSGKADVSAVTAVNNALTAHTSDTTIHVTSADKTAWNGKQDALSAGTGIQISGNVISVTGGGGGGNYYEQVSGLTIEADSENNDYPKIGMTGEDEDTGDVYNNIMNKWGLYTEQVGDTTYSASVGAGYIEMHDTGEIDSETTYDKTSYISPEGSHVTYMETYDDGEGNSYTSHQYDIYANEQSGFQIEQNYDDGNGNQTYASARLVNNQGDGTFLNMEDETGNSITLSPTEINWTDGRDSKQVNWSDIASTDDIVTYTAGNGIEIDSANTISVTGGGGASYSAGTNISIDTANTISCTIPLIVTGNTSIKQASNSTVSTPCNASAIFGSYNNVARSNLNYVFLAGNNNIAQNDKETAFGYYNKSRTGNTTSAQTLFTVGNGAYHAEHNALEIRKNGDIYVNDGTNDVRLQDTILALGGLKFVQCTQAQYDQWAQGGTIDSNTLYIINNVV